MQSFGNGMGSGSLSGHASGGGGGGFGSGLFAAVPQAFHAVTQHIAVPVAQTVDRSVPHLVSAIQRAAPAIGGTARAVTLLNASQHQRAVAQAAQQHAAQVAQQHAAQHQASLIQDFKNQLVAADQKQQQTQALQNLYSSLRNQIAADPNLTGANHVHSDSGLLAAIASPAASISHDLSGILPTAGHVLSNLGSDVLHLPQSTLEGVTQLGKAAVQSAVKNPLSIPLLLPDVAQNLAGVHLIHGSAGNSPLSQEVASAIKGDPIVQSVTHGSLNAIEQHPLNALLDVAGGAGAAAKGAGALARTGALGDTLKSAASTADVARPIVPGVGEAATQHRFSTNPLVKPIQKVTRDWVGAPSTEHGPIGQKVAAALQEHAIRRNIAIEHAAKTAQQAHEMGNSVEALMGAKPKDRALANIAPWAVQFGTSRDALTGALHTLQEARDSGATLKADVAKNLNAHITNLEKVLSNPTKYPDPVLHDTLGKVAAAYSPVQHQLEAQKSALDILDQAKADNSLRKRVALMHIPGAAVTPKVPHPDWVAMLHDSKSRIREADAAVKEAKAHADTVAASLHPGDMVTADHAHALADAKVAVEHADAAAKAVKAEHVQLTKSKFGLEGTVIPDHTANPIPAGPLKGLRMRQLQPEDVEHVFQQHPDLSYVRMTNPERRRIMDAQNLLSGATPRGGGINTAARVYTGEAAKVGDFLPGYEALLNSQLADVRTIGRAREIATVLDKYGDPTHYSTEAEASSAAASHEAKTGLKMVPLKDGAEYRVLPETVVKEIAQHQKLDDPGPLMRKYLGVNRLFKNTVLASSPKLPVMHTVESATRTALGEGLNPVGLARIPLDYARGRAYADTAGALEHKPNILGLKLRAEASAPERAAVNDVLLPARGGTGLPIEHAENLAAVDRAKQGSPSWRAAAQELVAPGANVARRLTDEEMGRMAPQQRGIVRNALHQAADIFDRTASTIIRGQRFLAKSADYVQLGAEARKTMQDFGSSWLQANKTVKDLADKTAGGLTNPTNVERAARELHHVMGQYNAMTVNTRRVMRFMPFASWYANAAKLVYMHLPMDHPLASSLIQNTAAMNQQQWDQQHAGLPSDMQTTLQTGPSSWLDIGKFTPVGVDKPAWSTAFNLAVPQIMSPLHALMGQDSFGQPLAGPNTPKYGSASKTSASPEGILGDHPGPAALQAGEQLLEELGGPLNTVGKILWGHGGTTYNTSTPALKALTGGLVGNVYVKPGTTGQQKGVLNLPGSLDKVLDPFHPTTLGGATAASGHWSGGKWVSGGPTVTLPSSASGPGHWSGGKWVSGPAPNAPKGDGSSAKPGHWWGGKWVSS